MAEMVGVPQSWREDALCRQVPGWLWDAEYPADPRVPLALAVCARCPVRDPCDAAARADPHVTGVWAGRVWRDGRLLLPPAPVVEPRVGRKRDWAEVARQVARLATEGVSIKGTAAVLDVSRRTVERYRRRQSEDTSGQEGGG